MTKYKDIHFRISVEERKRIESAAYAAGKSLSEYGRDILLAASDYNMTIMDNDLDSKKDNLSVTGEKSVHMNIRVSKNEMDYYIQQAEKADCSLSEYIRRSANGNSIYVVEGLPELTKQIAKLGVNINQLTVLAHQGKIKEVDLFPCNDTLKQILKELLKLTKKKG